VLAKAAEFETQYFAKHPQGRKGVKRPNKQRFVMQAIFVLAASKASKVHFDGITPRRFLMKHMSSFRARFSIRFREQLASRAREIGNLGRAPRDERSTG
jgi:hypothetical protein